MDTNTMYEHEQNDGDDLSFVQIISSFTTTIINYHIPSSGGSAGETNDLIR